MPPECALEPGAPHYTKSAGYSPLPGYVLIEPLGRGGFGEVWKCEAPGGLHKAVKFVTGTTLESDGAQLRQEYEAFQQVKAIRHPFLLSLERVELIDGELVMVMELADQQLGDRFAECRAQGLAGIPRDELLGYLREAAEALDVIGAKYGLQHLDVKPANLFLTAGHVQVGDYGLVSKLDAGKKGADNRGMTPRYAAPEVLAGQIHTRSDQYSLALVYFELLTGAFPYNGRNVQTVMLQHMMTPPDLTALPEADRPAVGTALAKNPEERFASCAAFIASLARAGRTATGTGRSGALVTPASGHVFDPAAASAPTRGPGGTDETRRHNVSAFVTPAPPAPRPRGRYPAPYDVLTPAPVEQMAGRPPSLSTIQLDRILSAIPVAWLQGREAARPERPATQLVNAVLSAAETEAGGIGVLGAVNREPQGAWACRFLTTIDARVAAVKLDLLWEEGGVTMDSRAPGRVVFRKLAPVPPPSGLFAGFSKKPKPPDSGLEVVVDLPDRAAPGTAEVVARGKFFGNPPTDFLRSGEKTIVRLLDGIRRTLGNVDDRRRHPRIPATFPITLYPLHSDGRLETPIRSLCHDVSAGGLALFCGKKPPSKYAYVTFSEVPGLTGHALLFQIIRTEWQDDEVLVTGRYRLDLDPQ